MTQQFTLTDHGFMARAITLAKKGIYTTSPNPRVGCVIVNNGEVVGEGLHVKAGQGHAEVHALAQAGNLAKGAVAYVTLEPCSHFGRTPPCALALIKAGIKKVVCAMTDPSPHVAGQGFEILREAGIEVAVGLLNADANALNRGYIKRMTTDKPLVICKLAASLDGKTAMANGDSQWITAKEARQDVQRLRARSCAIITSAASVMRDRARMTVRKEELLANGDTYPDDNIRQPVRVVIDSQNLLTPELSIFQAISPIIIIRTELENRLTWPHFVEQVVLPKAQDNRHVCLKALIDYLSKREMNEVLIEAGHHLAGAFIEDGLVDELVLYQAPKLLGATAMSLLAMPSLVHLSECISLNIQDVRQVGVDIRINATINATSKAKVNARTNVAVNTQK